MKAKLSKSNDIIFEVVQTLYMDSFTIGLYKTKESAIEAAKLLAKKCKYKKIDAVSWGTSDDYGILNGVSIVERKLLN